MDKAGTSGKYIGSESVFRPLNVDIINAIPMLANKPKVYQF